MKEGGTVASVRHQPLVVAEFVLEFGSSKDMCGRDRVSVAPTRVCSPIRVCGSSEDLCRVVWVWLRRGGVAVLGCKFGVDVRPYMDVSLVRMRIPSPVLLIPRSRTRWWFATGAKARP